MYLYRFIVELQQLTRHMIRHNHWQNPLALKYFYAHLTLLQNIDAAIVNFIALSETIAELRKLE